MLLCVEVANVTHAGKVGEERRIFRSIKCNRQNRQSLRRKIGINAQGKGRHWSLRLLHRLDQGDCWFPFVETLLPIDIFLGVTSTEHNGISREER